MKIYDCSMYFDEEIVLDVRLNTLNDFVDYFVIVESKFTHRGEKRNLKFNHEKFKKFKDKIIYLIKINESINEEDLLIEKKLIKIKEIQKIIPALIQSIRNQ